MIDPKLNEIPEKTTPASNNPSRAVVSEAAEREPAEKSRPGLSVQDTIASNANLSVGGRGADTSGVRAGAGAGAGGTHLSPVTTGGSPAPNVAPGPRGSAIPTATESPAGSPRTSGSLELRHEEVAAHAYRCWHERGCPEGSPEVDWHRAERELRERRSLKASAASA
jgi:DUF2934 family protein